MLVTTPTWGSGFELMVVITENVIQIGYKPNLGQLIFIDSSRIFWLHPVGVVTNGIYFMTVIIVQVGYNTNIGQGNWHGLLAA